MTRIALSDGTWLDRRTDGLFLWQPEERVVRATVTNGEATITTDGPRPEVLEVVPVVAAATARPAGGGKVKGATSEMPAVQKGRSDDAKRWDTLNEFEDLVARHLTTAEQSVWAHLFRHCRAGKASVSTRGMAEARGMAPNTVTAALRWIKDRGLVWEISKSTHRGASSVYGVHPRPGQLAAACEEANRPRIARRDRTPPRRPKPR